MYALVYQLSWTGRYDAVCYLSNIIGINDYGFVYARLPELIKMSDTDFKQRFVFDNADVLSLIHISEPTRPLYN